MHYWADQSEELLQRGKITFDTKFTGDSSP
jgi:hypothetical protein